MRLETTRKMKLPHKTFFSVFSQEQAEYPRSDTRLSVHVEACPAKNCQDNHHSEFYPCDDPRRHHRSMTLNVVGRFIKHLARLTGLENMGPGPAARISQGPATKEAFVIRTLFLLKPPVTPVPVLPQAAMARNKL
ncbi:hypothetical protein CIHG_05771 [Coccidioides immitis H538.4]|uniref:Uncharacterized protein n=3 Tax=Coccidioides immitis TaxID=5501 RepID=A0A0J8TRG0_COCIT|nr:hypothetical protein CIRG_01842 [Coccidioides immitis RMSCC 2394]KMU76317.1 hypothetical protein CISG_01052 [Coccidioides immitis RMSCC 3703]KMU88004.1 hypothetical protein CIHG_05771 [Coccidioides immitis H538.4]